MSLRGGRLRFMVDLHHTDNGVEGEVTLEDASRPRRFSGWLELLRVLEPSREQGWGRWGDALGQYPNGLEAVAGALDGIAAAFRDIAAAYREGVTGQTEVFRRLLEASVARRPGDWQDPAGSSSAKGVGDHRGEGGEAP